MEEGRVFEGRLKLLVVDESLLKGAGLLHFLLDLGLQARSTVGSGGVNPDYCELSLIVEDDF